MKRSGFRPPTKEQIDRQTSRRRDSLRRYEEKRRKELAERRRIQGRSAGWDASLPASGGLKRKKRLSQVPTTARGRARNRARFERAYLSTAYVSFIHWKGCVVRGCTRTDIHACHRVSRGAGGTWRDLFGGCGTHHDEQHRIGIQAFEARHTLDLEAECARNVTEWMAFTADPAHP